MDNTISNINVIVQHGDNAKEAQNIRNQNVEAGQMAAVHKEREEEKTVTVQESDESEKLSPDQEGSQNEQRKHRRKQKKKKTSQKSIDTSGHIVDTVV